MGRLRTLGREGWVHLWKSVCPHRTGSKITCCSDSEDDAPSMRGRGWDPLGGDGVFGGWVDTEPWIHPWKCVSSYRKGSRISCSSWRTCGARCWCTSPAARTRDTRRSRRSRRRALQRSKRETQIFMKRGLVPQCGC